MNKKTFDQNLQAVYELSLKMDEIISLFATNANEISKEKDILTRFLIDNRVPVNENSLLALGKRVAFLKLDSLDEYLHSCFSSEEKIQKVLEHSFDLTKQIHLVGFVNLLIKIDELNLLPSFYIKLLWGVYDIGVEMNNLFLGWQSTISKANASLEKRFDSKEKIIKYLEKENLFDKDQNGEPANWCYSCLIESENGYERLSYSKLMPDETKKVVKKIKNLQYVLGMHEDEIFNQEENYQNYLQSLIDALIEEDVDKLFERWTQVDRDWMKIEGPIQICHPFEYYDDHYRNAVGIDFDVRIDNSNINADDRKEKVHLMSDWMIFNKLSDIDCEVYDQFTFNLKHVSLHLGKPLMYFGGYFEGLFSAQVVPNNEVVASEFGKKIFAFPDMVLANQRNQPRTKLSKEVFSKNLLKKINALTYEKTQEWFDCYEIKTIGHEFSHILFVGNDTEKQMNVSGEYKNLEEFKATAGGIMSFLLVENTSLSEDLIVKLIKRSFSTIPWMDRNDRYPYYLEGLFNLIHLYKSRLISFKNERIQFNWDIQNYCDFYISYEKMYLQIIKHYFAKKDSKEFIEEYMCLEDGTWFPKNSDLKNIVKWYYDKHKKFGNVPA